MDDDYRKLTPREREVIEHLLKGRSNKEIGRLLQISDRTIEVHRARALEKLAARNVYQLAYKVALQQIAINTLVTGRPEVVADNSSLLERVDDLVGETNRQSFINAAVEKALAQFEMTHLVFRSQLD